MTKQEYAWVFNFMEKATGADDPKVASAWVDLAIRSTGVLGEECSAQSEKPEQCATAERDGLNREFEDGLMRYLGLIRHKGSVGGL